MKRFCTSCGKELEASHRFCVACGASASLAADPPVRHRNRVVRIGLVALGAIVGSVVLLLALALLPGGSASTSWQLKSGEGEA